MRRLNSAGLALVVFGVVFGIGTLGAIPSDEKGLALIELLRFFLFTCAVGGAVLVYRQVQAQDRSEEDKRIKVREARMAIVDAFHGIVYSRRMMRLITARAEDDIRIYRPDDWIVLVRELNKYQLIIERLRREHMPGAGINDQQSQKVYPQLKVIDSFVRGVLLEIEENMDEDCQRIRCSESSRLRSFLLSDDPPAYVTAFLEIDAAMREWDQINSN